MTTAGRQRGGGQTAGLPGAADLHRQPRATTIRADENLPTPCFSINSINFSSSFEFHRPFFKLKCNLLRYLEMTQKQRDILDATVAPCHCPVFCKRFLRFDIKGTDNQRKT